MQALTAQRAARSSSQMLGHRIAALFSLSLALLSPPAAARKSAAKTFYKASVRRPGYSVVQRLALTGKVRDFRAHSPGVPLGGTRFVSIVSSQKAQVVHLVVVDKQGKRWQLLHRLALPKVPAPDDPRAPNPDMPKGTKCDPCSTTRLAAIVYVKDYDKDGKPEALARHLYCYVIPAIGDVTYRRMFVINLDGKPRIALNLDFGYDAGPTSMGAKKVSARFRDIDGDGHPDVVTTSIDRSFGEKPSKSRAVYLWRKATDSYKAR
jgi:hypothetical protein